MRSALSTARPRIGAPPRPCPRSMSAMVSRSSATVLSVVSESPGTGWFAASRVPAFSSRATAASASPMLTAPGFQARVEVRRSVRENTASLSERCATAQAAARSASVVMPGPASRSRPAWARGRPTWAACRCRASSTSSRASKPSSVACLCQLFSKRVPVHLALVGAGHERRPLREALVLRRIPKPLRRHRRLDLGTPGGEGLDDVPWNRGTPRRARNLEAPVRVGLPDAVAELLQAPCQLGAVERADQHLRRIELLVRHGAPLRGPGRSPVFVLHHVGDHRMRMELGVEIARDLVAEGGDHRLLVPGAHHAAALCIHRPGLDDVLLDPGEGPLHCRVMGGDDAFVAADQGRDGYGLGRGEGDVAAGAMVDRAVPQPAAEPAARAVRHGAFENAAEDVGIDGPGEPQSGCAPARPGAGLPVRRVFLRVVPVPLVVGDALGGRGDRADGGDHVRT